MDDGGKEAMSGGVKIIGVQDGAFEFDGFEGVCAVKEMDLFDNVRAFRGDPKVEGEKTSVQGPASVE